MGSQAIESMTQANNTNDRHTFRKDSPVPVHLQLGMSKAGTSQLYFHFLLVRSSTSSFDTLCPKWMVKELLEANSLRNMKEGQACLRKWNELKEKGSCKSLSETSCHLKIVNSYINLIGKIKISYYSTSQLLLPLDWNLWACVKVQEIEKWKYVCVVLLVVGWVNLLFKVMYWFLLLRFLNKPQVCDNFQNFIHKQ